jgi:hypothetical protein
MYNENDVKMYVSTIDETFYNSVKSVLDALTNNQVIYKGLL